MEYKDRVTVITVGVQNYDYLKKLNGPQKDIDRIHDLLFKNKTIALFNEEKLISLFDCESEKFRQALNEYVQNRSALNDILLLYFSGHGTSLLDGDFAFCLKDTMIDNRTGTILPLSIVSFSDVIYSLKIAGVIPLFIIDSCRSGKTGEFLNNFEETKQAMRKYSDSNLGSNYAIFCSCSGSDVAQEDDNGGFFSSCFYDIAISGIKTSEYSQSELTITDLFPEISSEMEKRCIDYRPLLYKGETFLKFPLIKNSGYKPSEYSFHPAIKKFLVYLWNNGNCIRIATKDIPKKFESGVYGNHSKLSYDVWDLVQNSPNKTRELTQRGKDFVSGKLKIPKTIVKHSKGKYIAKSGTKNISINDV